METITKNMVIGDILKDNPDHTAKLAETMQSYGLHCVGCQANAFESLEAGVSGHGMGDEKVNKLVADLNEIVSKKVERKGIKLTKLAVEKIKQTLSNDGKVDFGIRLTVSGSCCSVAYGMDIEETSKSEDKLFEQDGVKLFVDRTSMDKIDGTEIDFVTVGEQSGFSFNNPNKTKGSCGCGD